METINGDLLIKGDLICGEDGILNATGSVIWGFALVREGESKDRITEMFKEVPEGDFDLAGRQIRVEGNCYVFGNIVYDPYKYKGNVTAGCS